MSKKKPKPVSQLARKRPAGLDGTHSGTCIICLRATDTALGVRGDAEWHAGFLMALGMPTDEAAAVAGKYLGYIVDPPGFAAYRVCARCAAKVPSFPTPVLATNDAILPTIGQPG